MKVTVCDRCETNCTDNYFSAIFAARPYSWETKRIESVADLGPSEINDGDAEEYFELCPDCRADIICDIYSGKKEAIGDVQ